MVSLFSLSLEISFDYCLLTQTRHTLAFLREILATLLMHDQLFGGRLPHVDHRGAVEMMG